MKKSMISLVLILVMTGCANGQLTSTGQGTLLGALGGAAAGAAIGGVSGSNHVGRDAAIGAAVGAIGGFIWSSQMEKQRQEMEKATQGTGIEVSKTTNNELKLDVPSDFSFDVGKFAIKTSMVPILNKFAYTLNQNPVTRIRIVGYTDSTGSDAINYPLSVNRANAVRNYLVSVGVDPSRITIDGRGPENPVADNATAAGRAQNRRVEIFVAEPAQQAQPAQY